MFPRGDLIEQFERGCSGYGKNEGGYQPVLPEGGRGMKVKNATCFSVREGVECEWVTLQDCWGKEHVILFYSDGSRPIVLHRYIDRDKKQCRREAVNV